MKGIGQAFLTFRDDAINSDKYYDAQLDDLENGYYATFFNWGRRGSAGQEQVKIHPDLGTAKAAYTKKIQDKSAARHGYTVVSRTGPNETYMLSTHVAGEIEMAANKYAGKDRMESAPVFTATTVDLTSLVSMAQRGV